MVLTEQMDSYSAVSAHLSKGQKVKNLPCSFCVFYYFREQFTLHLGFNRRPRLPVYGENWFFIQMNYLCCDNYWSWEQLVAS